MCSVAEPWKRPWVVVSGPGRPLWLALAVTAVAVEGRLGAGAGSGGAEQDPDGDDDEAAQDDLEERSAQGHPQEPLADQ